MAQVPRRVLSQYGPASGIFAPVETSQPGADGERRVVPGRTMGRKEFITQVCCGAALAATRSGGGGKRSSAPVPKRVRGLFAFDPSVDADAFVRACREWGVDTAILHPGFFHDGRMSAALARAGIALAERAVFFDQAYLEAHPDCYAITSRGRKAVEGWLHFACPSREDLLERRVRELRDCLSNLEPPILSLDFIRHFVFWEKVDLNGPPAAIEDGCYCELCLSSFGRYCGETVESKTAAARVRSELKGPWSEWKCRTITAVAERLFAEARRLRPEARLAIKTVPWREQDLDGAIRSCAGQDVAALGRQVDMVAPMAFTHVLGQTPEWKRALLAHVKAVGGKPVVSYVQTEKLYRDEAITPEQFEAELTEALDVSWAGTALFDYQQLAADPVKAALLHRRLKTTKA